jgi:N-acetyl-1-D-myo-inositol-2-amino-2-deoxy-alpha-D-glucopyranoside deacetylase
MAKEKDKVLVITGAHPDDESFGAGGTLAYYVQKGMKVYYICATRGEAGEVAPEMLKGYSNIAQLRTYETQCAANALGLQRVIFLDYRDSGMAGSPDNKNPLALVNAPVEEVAKKITSHLRALRPQVIITSDPAGGYGHPDHIAIHLATLKAFNACNDGKLYPESGQPYQPQKLYYNVFHHTWMRMSVRIWQLMGRDVRHFGRNKDIDLLDMLKDEFPVHCVIKLTKQAVETGNKASSCHASQLGGGGGPRRGLREMMNKLFGYKATFMRAYPEFKGGRKEKDLFEGVG